MTATTTAPVFTPTTRFLPLFTWDGCRRPVGHVHLAKVKTTKAFVTQSWCGRTLFPHETVRTITGEDARLLAFDEKQPTCALCLARVGAWEWEW